MSYTNSHYSEDEEAALWVARHMNNMVDVIEFKEWLDGSPGRRERFDALWATCMEDAVTQGLQLTAAQEWPWWDETSPYSAKERQSTFWNRTGLFGAVAASLVAILTFAWPYLHPEGQVFTTAAGQTREVVLADGSTVILNGASRISAQISDEQRNITLEAGEALFDVTHDPARPFTVIAAEGRATVLGTRFDLALNNKSLDLEVERGKVRLEPLDYADRAVVVTASHRASLMDSYVSQPLAIEKATATSWEDGWLEAQNMSLGEIIPRLQRWTDRQIRVEDAGLLTIPAAGRFRLSDPDLVLESLGTLYHFKVTKRDNAFVLSKQ
ncbi:hypothetical protein GRI39_05105 [Altererythrobacter indicus]|uniref:FecR family protein n=1 Tax=Altericroceibacterium indicum TaxID=374177 RepID=A0A845A8T6_9SPHN|nr:FecR domain-containing protein [Altericroceibacterium indicum]MXP25421.1 hypothetical protein [Altericroceibacterium indicum]